MSYSPLAEALSASIDADLLNAGVAVRSAHPAAADFRSDTWARRCRQILDYQGVAHRALPDDAAVIREAVRSIGIGTVDIASYVQQSVTRAVGEGFANAPSIWRAIARPVQLKNHLPTPAGATLDTPVSLRSMPQAGEARTPAIAARAETLTAATFGENIAFTREAMLAGDLTATLRLAEAVGRAAAWTIDDALIDLLTSNSGVGPTLAQDSTALFDASGHANYITSGAAPSVSTLNVARAALRKQQDQNSTRRMNTPAKTLLVPAALEGTANVLAASEARPGADPLEVVVSARLDDFSATGWYLFADPLLFDTLALGFVGEGEPAPIVGPMKALSRNTDATVFGVRFDFGVCALDFRGMFYNDGA